MKCSLALSYKFDVLFLLGVDPTGIDDGVLQENPLSEVPAIWYDEDNFSVAPHI
jgi:hypothetical protein